MKQKRVEMHGESAGEQARGKSWQSWRQKQQQKCKTATSQTSKQVNVDGRGTRMPSTLPRLGPVQGGMLRRSLLRAQKHWRNGGHMEGWAPGGGPGSHKEPCGLQRIPPSRQRGLTLFCPSPSSRSKSGWEAEDQPLVGVGSRTTLLMVPNSSLGWNAPFLQARGTTEREGYGEKLWGAGPQNITAGGRTQLIFPPCSLLQVWTSLKGRASCPVVLRSQSLEPPSRPSSLFLLSGKIQLTFQSLLLKDLPEVTGVFFVVVVRVIDPLRIW